MIRRDYGVDWKSAMAGDFFATQQFALGER
jgi:hypothetical protein